MRAVRDDEIEQKMGGPRFLRDRVNGIYEHQGSFGYGHSGPSDVTHKICNPYTNPETLTLTLNPTQSNAW